MLFGALAPPLRQLTETWADRVNVDPPTLAVQGTLLEHPRPSRVVDRSRSRPLWLHVLDRQLLAVHERRQPALLQRAKQG